MDKSSATIEGLSLSGGSTTGSPISLDIHARRRTAAKKRGAPRSIENAVYAYIRAVRVLGRKQINTVDVAEALAIPVDAVNRAVRSLRKKGVKALHA